MDEKQYQEYLVRIANREQEAMLFKRERVRERRQPQVTVRRGNGIMKSKAPR